MLVSSFVVRTNRFNSCFYLYCYDTSIAPQRQGHQDQALTDHNLTFLGNMGHPDHPYEGYTVYIITQVAYALYSTARWQDSAYIGKYFIVPRTAITYTDKKS